MGADGRNPRYRAFISYSHRDAAFGRRLHRWLEGYAVPRRLVGRVTERGTIPSRVAPIFRDREELTAADNLTAEVRAALSDSGALIVVCSPNAAASPWVAREIELFRGLHPDRPVLAALIDGEPEDAFPAPLVTPGPDGRPTEPLAADFRKDGDGSRHALLKLIGGVIGAGLGELVQRDAQRRLRTVTAVTAASVTAMLAMGMLTIFAFQARVEADRQRAEAEGLVEFMLTDLRDRLKGVGRLDVLTSVNERAIGYYGGQDLQRLPAESLERRARLLHAMGEDDISRGDLDAATMKFSEARRVTRALLLDDPGNPDRIWAQGQSEFWNGYVAYERERLAEAATAFGAYSRLSNELVGMDGDNVKYLREAGYADGNLCSLALEPPRRPRDALKACGDALARMEKAATLAPKDPAVQADLANRNAWMADAWRAAGKRDKAREHRLAEERILDALIAADPKNQALRGKRVASQRALAGLEAAEGRRAEATARLRRALVELDRLIAFDPENKAWRDLKDLIETNITGLASENYGKDSE